jgi:hypothetical protein
MADKWDIAFEARNFYALMAIEAGLVPLNGIQLPSIEKLKEDTKRVADKYIHDLAVIMRDYMTTIAAGEARHAPTACAAHIATLKGGNRGSVYSQIRAFDPIQVLEQLVILFDNYHWSSSYGGKKWGNIAKAALASWKGLWPDRIFIDHSIDLAHNGNLCWDKGVVFTGETHYLKLFLDVKTHRPLDHWGVALKLDPPIASLVQRAAVLGLVDLKRATPVAISRPNSLLKHPYEPIVWGALTIPAPEGRRCDDCGELLTHDNMSSENGHLCESCYEASEQDDHDQCCHCGCAIGGDYGEAYAEENSDYCQDCWDKKYAVYCAKCEEKLSNGDTYHFNDETYCWDCYCEEKDAAEEDEGEEEDDDDDEGESTDGQVPQEQAQPLDIYYAKGTPEHEVASSIPASKYKTASLYTRPVPHG